MATLENVQAKIARLQAQAEALAAKQSSGVIAKIRDLMEKHGLTVADIEAHTGGKKRGLARSRLSHDVKMRTPIAAPSAKVVMNFVADRVLLRRSLPPSPKYRS